MHNRHRMPRKKIPNNICRAHTKGVRAKAPAPFAICCISIYELLYVMMLVYVLKEQLIMAEESKARGPMDPRDFWRQWYEATTGALAKAAELEGDPLGITAQWLKVMEENRAKILAGGTTPADPYTFFKQWYEASSETWSKVVGDIIGEEKFVENASQIMESYTSHYMVTRRANEDYFRNLQLPTRSDLARVAEIIVALEEKVDHLDEAFEDSRDEFSQVATKEAFSDLEGRLSRVEKKLDVFSSALEKKLEVVEKLAKHTDDIEKKLDKVLAAFVKIEVNNASTAKTTDVEAARKTTKKNVRSQKPNGSKAEVQTE